MAQVAAQGCLKLKLLFNNGEGASFGLDARDRVCSLLKLTHLAKHSSRVVGSCISSSCSEKPPCFSVDPRFSVHGEGLDDWEYDGEFEDDELACFRGLVLDVAYRPVDVVCWRQSICLAFTEKADVLEYYDQTVSSPSGLFQIPAVLRVPHLIQVVKRRRIKHNLTRKNILYRDKYSCQYCTSDENLTIDHVLPTAQGGKWEWENLVTACAKCNTRKGHKTLEEAKMKLIKVPKAPKDYDIHAIPLTSTAVKMMRLRKGTPKQWRQYLPQPSS